MSPINRSGSVTDLRSFHRRVAPEQQRHPRWKLSNQIRDIFNESSRPVPTSLLPGFSVSEASIAEQVPSAANTWDWFTNSPRPFQNSSFRGGSTLVSDRANVEVEIRSPASGFERDPILEGDSVEYVPEKRRFPDASHQIFDTGERDAPGRRLLIPRPAYDPTRAGIRTDVNPEFRRCFRQVPTPASYHQETPSRQPPRSHLWRSRDIIVQHEPEFLQAPNPSIKTFPRHLQGGSCEQTYRPSKRFLPPSESETALRTMHYCIPAGDDGYKTDGYSERNRTKKDSISDVINYRFSGGICPPNMKLSDGQEQHEQYEKDLELYYRTDVARIQQLCKDNIERSRRKTTIF